MRLRWTVRFAALCSVMLLVSSSLLRAADDGEFKPMFNGKDLSGWTGDKDLWSFADGVVTGSTESKKLTHNSFLATEKPYKNFIIKAQFKLRNHNSGIQIRSKQFPDYVVKGYQSDMDEANTYTGALYEEGGRGILAKPAAGSKDKVKKGEWNDYLITVDGPHIKQEVNGFTTVDYTEKDEVKGAKEGIIALQLHAGAPMKVEYKDVMIKVLPDSK